MLVSASVALTVISTQTLFIITADVLTAGYLF